MSLLRSLLLPDLEAIRHIRLPPPLLPTPLLSKLIQPLLRISRGTSLPQLPLNELLGRLAQEVAARLAAGRHVPRMAASLPVEAAEAARAVARRTAHGTQEAGGTPPARQQSKARLLINEYGIPSLQSSS